LKAKSPRTLLSSTTGITTTSGQVHQVPLAPQAAGQTRKTKGVGRSGGQKAMKNREEVTSDLVTRWVVTKTNTRNTKYYSNQTQNLIQLTSIKNA
jgi:hypothetical protein